MKKEKHISHLFSAPVGLDSGRLDDLGYELARLPHQLLVPLERGLPLLEALPVVLPTAAAVVSVQEPLVVVLRHRRRERQLHAHAHPFSLRVRICICLGYIGGNEEGGSRLSSPARSKNTVTAPRVHESGQIDASEPPVYHKHTLLLVVIVITICIIAVCICLCEALLLRHV